MNRHVQWLVCIGISAFTCAAPAVAQLANQGKPAQRAAPVSTRVDWKAVEAGMGRSGSLQPGGVFRFGMPRGDLAVTTQGVQVKPALSLGSWIAFKEISGGEVVAMGDGGVPAAEPLPTGVRPWTGPCYLDVQLRALA